MALDIRSQLTHKETNKKIRILWLSEDDMVEAGVLDAGRAVDVMEEVVGLLEDGDAIMGGPDHDQHGMMLYFPKHSDIPGFPLNNAADRRFIAMPAYIGGRFHLAGCKWYGSNGRNRQHGLPRSILMMMLNDVETGAPLAYMSANLLSSIRTGAMPGLAAKLLAIKDSKTLALIGAGPIGKSSVMAILSKIKTIEEIKIKGSTPESATAKEAKEFIEVNFPWVKKVTVAETLEEAIRDSDIVTEAVSCKEGEWPEYKAECIKPGATVISTSTFNMDYKSILPFKKVVDNIGMYENYADEDNEGYDSEGRRNHTGCMGEDFVYMVRDGLMKMDDISELGQIVRGKREGRVSDDEIILVSIEGMPVEDVAWGYECYKNAKENLIGRPLKLWDSPITF